MRDQLQSTLAIDFGTSNSAAAVLDGDRVLRVPLEGREITREALQSAFEAVYWARFRVKLDTIRAAVINANCSVIGVREALDLSSILPPDARADSLDAARREVRPVRFDGEVHDTPVYRREALPAASMIDGPAVIEQMDSTVLLPPGDRAESDMLGNLVITIGGTE